MSDSQNSIGAVFRRLHEQKKIFVIPNPWDVGSARILASIGFSALATTSAGMAFSMGIREGVASVDETWEHCKNIVNATPLPVSADLEKGFGDSPEMVAACITSAAKIGLAGCSIEDHTGRKDDPIFEFTLAVERIAAAADAAARLDDDFMLTARCENLLWNIPSIDDTIKRLQAYSDAGADVLYAPGLRDLETIKTVCQSLDKPLNVVMGLPGATFSIEELAAAGVKRISVGSALARYAYGALIEGATEISEHGTFSYSDNAIGFAALEKHF